MQQNKIKLDPNPSLSQVWALTESTSETFIIIFQPVLSNHSFYFLVTRSRYFQEKYLLKWRYHL